MLKCAVAGLIVAVSVAPAFWWSAAAAFEYQGFRSGMSLTEAEAIALTHHGGKKLEQCGAVQDCFTVGPAAGSSINFSICHGQLFGMNITLSGGVDAFASKAKELNARYGAPTVAVTSEYTETGLLSNIVLTWLTPSGEDESVSLISFKNSLAVSLGFSAFRLLCQ